MSDISHDAQPSFAEHKKAYSDLVVYGSAAYLALRNVKGLRGAQLSLAASAAYIAVDKLNDKAKLTVFRADMYAGRKILLEGLEEMRREMEEKPEIAMFLAGE